jgi:dephospho-CoA kinase
VTGRQYVIGLTGNIATGKSSVAAILGRLGARVLDADVVAHEVMRGGTDVYQRVVDEFGPSVLHQDGEIDRKRLGAVVFADARAMARLEAIVHPAVLREKERLLETWRRDEPDQIVVVEAIKLIESGMHRKCDELWVVTSPREQQVQRLVAKRGLSLEEAEARVDAQGQQSDKVAHADLVIANAGTLHELERRVTAEWERVTRSAGRVRGEAHPTRSGGTMASLQKWIEEHPSLTMWVVLSVGMVAIFGYTSRGVPLLWHQRFFMAIACVVLAALCTWIVNWE